jgi:hypothetical protein
MAFLSAGESAGQERQTGKSEAARSPVAGSCVSSCVLATGEITCVALLRWKDGTADRSPQSFTTCYNPYIYYTLRRLESGQAQFRL